MLSSMTIKNYRTMTLAAIAAIALSGCGQMPTQTALKTASRIAVTAKKPGHELTLATAAIRTYLQTTDGQHIVQIRSLDVVPGPTIQIYPPVEPTMFDFTARISVEALDDRLAQYVVSGTYSSVTRLVRVTDRKPAVF